MSAAPPLSALVEAAEAQNSQPSSTAAKREGDEFSLGPSHFPAPSESLISLDALTRAVSDHQKAEEIFASPSAASGVYKRAMKMHSTSSPLLSYSSPHLSFQSPDSLNGAARRKFSSDAEGSSCHQCKSRRAFADLTYCTSSLNKKNKNAVCRKKYCGLCLSKFYRELPPKSAPSSMWRCPSCRKICCCAACRRREIKGSGAPSPTPSQGMPLSHSHSHSHSHSPEDFMRDAPESSPSSTSASSPSPQNSRISGPGQYVQHHQAATTPTPGTRLFSDGALSSPLESRRFPSLTTKSEQEGDEVDDEDLRESSSRTESPNSGVSGSSDDEDGEDINDSQDSSMRPPMVHSSPASLGMHRLLLSSPAVSSASHHSIGLSLLGAIPPAAPLNSTLNLSFERLRHSGTHSPSPLLNHQTPVKTAASPSIGPSALQIGGLTALNLKSPSLRADKRDPPVFVNGTPLSSGISAIPMAARVSPGPASDSLLASFTLLWGVTQNAEFLTMASAIRASEDLSNKEKLSQLQEAIKNVERKILSEQIKL